MSADWVQKPLGEVVSLQRGHDLPTQKRVQGSVPIMGSAGITGWHNEVKVKAPGVVVGRSGNSMGEVHFCNADYWPLNTCLFVTDFKGNDERFIYLLLHLINFDQFNSGSAQKSLNRNAVYPYEVILPESKEEQAKIANLVFDFSSKIELNRQINQTLESMAQTIFKSWFVDFDPVKAKIAAIEAGEDAEGVTCAAMRAISGKTDDELDKMEGRQPDDYAKLKTTAELFPSAIQDSELGEVPEGWGVRPFGNLLSHTIGGDWGKDKPDAKHQQRVKILRGTDLPKVYSGDDSAVPIRFVDTKKLSSRKLKAGDIVIEVSGGSKNQPTGRSLFLTQKIIERLNAILEPASFCRLFRPVDVKLGLMLGLHLMKIYEDGKTWQYQNQSTGISNFQTKVFLEKEMVVVPYEDLIEEFYMIVNPLIQKIHSSENQQLAKLRDTLLPKLLSGELSVDAIKTTNNQGVQ